MELQQLTNHIFYYPHQTETDRPMLAYVKGDKLSLAIDAGNSSDHVAEFYQALQNKNHKFPDLTVITHWHWDHTFGMHKVNGLTITNNTTNQILQMEKEKIQNEKYLKALKSENPFLAKEFSDGKAINIVSSDVQFKNELSLSLGHLTAKIFHTTSPHSPDSSLIYIPEEKVLFLGDATSEDFENNGYMDQNKLKSLITGIEKIDCNYCMLGHAQPLQKNELVDYLKSTIS
ncbi:MBL fold metallo-hydrolase [Tetragenococcus halophilus]|uniref:MBL fold metallo-hydrolase n=1 Tax=Tetragenococcus halophilus TaxID=51669 RepID=A0A3G5FHX7_TETHA|nr:MBL fold metallo-hydrolase [Tetragenococcus halophilus]AYW49946.1 MBL fold metallo-hydrolase [Tetragenococcus halophilus]GBD63292.1 putative uncharacterized protein [Tetragenococcus halophilus subsp. flandriensis]